MGLFDGLDIQQLELGYKAHQLQKQKLAAYRQQQAMRKPQGRGGPGTAFISEGGGMAGAMGGAVAGATIGSAVPVIGTAIGGLVGAGIGGFAGGTAGRLAENKIRDDEYRPGEALKEGAISGVLGAGPLRAGKAVVGGAKALKGGSKLADAMLAAGEKTNTPGMISKAGTKLDDMADNAAIKQFRLNPSQQDSLTHRKTKETAGKLIRRYGLRDVDDIEGATAKIQGHFDEALDTIGEVSKKDVLANFQTQIDRLKKSAPSEYKKAGAQLEQEAVNIAESFGDTIPAKELNKIRQQFDGLVSYSMKQTDPAKYKVNKRAADAIRNTIQKYADNLQLTSPTGKSFKEVGQDLSRLYKLSEYSQRQSGLGKGSLPAGLINTVAAGGGAAAGGIPGAITGAAITQGINSPMGRRGLSKAAELASGGLGKLGRVTDGIGNSTFGPAARVGAGSPLFGPTGQQPSLEDSIMQGIEGTGLEGMYADPEAGQQSDPAAMDGTEEMTQQESSPYTRENLIEDIQRDPKHAADYIKTYKELSEIYAPAGKATKGRNSAASGVIADTKTGLNALKGLSGSISQSNANSPIMGFLRSKNPYDTEAQNLQTNIATAKQIVGKALEGGVLRKEDEYKYAKILPKMTDTDAVAKHKLELLAQLISQRLQEYEASLSGSSGGSLEDALMAAQ